MCGPRTSCGVCVSVFVLVLAVSCNLNIINNMQAARARAAATMIQSISERLNGFRFVNVFAGCARFVYVQMNLIANFHEQSLRARKVYPIRHI